MVEFTFTSSQLFFLALRCIGSAVLPFVIFAYLHQKHGGRFYPVIIGMVSLILLSMPRALARGILIRGIESFQLRFIVAALIGAAFEECGRYLAMTHAMPNHDTVTDALCYGIGHGGVEALSTAVNQLGFWMLAAQYNGVALPEDSQNAAQLQILAPLGAFEAVDLLFGEIVAMAFHLVMSVLIFRAISRGNCRRYLPAAIVLHALYNYLTFSFGIIIATVIAAGLCWFVYRRQENS